jgi:branched-chain amino acid transport system substrate-binding protein
MRRASLLVVCALLSGITSAQNAPAPCDCGGAPPGRPASRTLKPYGGVPDDLRPFSKYTKPYYEHYTDLIEYNGAARDLPDPDLRHVSEIKIGFLGPLHDHPEQAMGNRMLHGASLAIEQANAAGGYCGKPYRLMLHNDSAIWGAASNEVVKMVYDEKVWAMFGSISGDTTHIALRVALKAETPLVNSAATDPTIPETIIPWYFTDLQDDRVQGYTLARHIYIELGLKRIALLRVNDRYGRFGVLKFRDASRRLQHPVVIEQKFLPGETDFRPQLRVIADSRVDGLVLWTDIKSAALILQQMQELGMKQRVFGSHRTIGDQLIQLAGSAAEGYEALYPYDPTRTDSRWADFERAYESHFDEKPDHFAALAYDAMQILVKAICRAGLNKGRIRDALTATEHYKGVTGDMMFDPNCKNISPMFLATVHNQQIDYQRVTMEKPYANVHEQPPQYSGPISPGTRTDDFKVAVFGPSAEDVIHTAEITAALDQLKQAGHSISLVPIVSNTSWGKASTALVDAIYKEHVLAVIALDRPSSHLAEQIGTKAFVPVLAISSDRMLTSTNIPWIFRLPPQTSLIKAVQVLAGAAERGGQNREKIRESLASGMPISGMSFQPSGELK